MRALRPRLTQDGQAGFGLAEVLVAMFLLAVVSVGVLHSLVSTLSVNRDARARQIAANLAAQEIDRARESDDLFQLLPETKAAYTVGTDTFHVVREAEWVSDPAADFDCGTGGGNLRYKRVSITVTWDGMRADTDPVRSDTIIDPDDRINDPALGTVLVSVLDGAGLGASGVPVTVQQVNPTTGSPIGAAVPASTDLQGCVYVLKMPPGTYQVTLNKPGYINTALETEPTTTIGVDAGATASTAFEYDREATVRVYYATNLGEMSPKLPIAGMSTTFASTAGYVNLTGDGTGSPRDFTVYPFASGYTVFAGRDRQSDDPSVTCRSVNPANWPGGTPSGTVAAVPGDTVDVDVPMAVVMIDLGGAVSGRHLKAVNASPPPGSEDPGCQDVQTLSFGPTLDDSGRAVIALPYGSWRITRGGSTGQDIVVPGDAVLPQTRGLVSGDVVTLDPREP